MIRKLSRILRQNYERLIPSGDLGELTAKSSFWAFLTNISNRVLYLVMLIIVGRIVGPAAVGLYTAGLIILSLSDKVTYTGVREALIQRKKDNIIEYFNTVYLIRLLRGVVILLILFLAAPLAAKLFSEPTLVALLPALAIGKFIIMCRSPGIIRLRRDLDLHKIFVYKISGSLGQFITGIGLAYLWGTVWALIFAHVVDKIVRTAVSFGIHPYRPSFDFEWAKAREILDYGKWMTGSKILFFLYDRGDDAFVGWLLSSAALGWYSMAFRFSNAPSTEISKVISSVLFPTFSKTQKDTGTLRETYFKSLRLITLLAFPIAFGIIGAAPAFVAAFLGPDWSPMVVPMQLLAVYGLFETIAKPSRQIWKAIGKPDYNTKISAARVLMTAVLIYPATVNMGITGTALVVIGVYLLTEAPLQFYLIARILETSYYRLAVELGYPLLASAVMLCAVVVVRDALSVHISPVLQLLILVFTGIIVYTVAVGVSIIGSKWKIREDIEQALQNLMG